MDSIFLCFTIDILGQRRFRIFPLHRDNVLTLSAIHRRVIVIVVITRPRVYRDGLRHPNRCVFGLKDKIKKKIKALFVIIFVRIKNIELEYIYKRLDPLFLMENP